MLAFQETKKKKDMKKILRFYDMAAKWLCHFGSDKYVHLLCGLLIGFMMASVFTYLSSSRIFGIWIAFVLTCAIGFIKEVVDAWRGGNCDVMDMFFTNIGGVIGCILFLL